MWQGEAHGRLSVSNHWLMPCCCHLQNQTGRPGWQNLSHALTHFACSGEHLEGMYELNVWRYGRPQIILVSSLTLSYLALCAEHRVFFQQCVLLQTSTSMSGRHVTSLPGLPSLQCYKIIARAHLPLLTDSDLDSDVDSDLRSS